MTTIINQLFHSNTELFPLFSLQHVIIISVACLLIFLVLSNKKMISNPATSFWLRVSLLFFIIIQQLLLYSWYYFNNAFDVVDALPLYPCRITSIVLVLMLIKMNKKIFHVLFYWGIIGPILALISPDTENLGFPNAMFIQYFIGHIAILVGVIFLAVSNDYKPSTKGLKTCYIYSLIYFSFILVINELLGSNYAYLKHKPPGDFLAFIPGFPFHVPIVIGLMFSLFYLVNVGYRLFSRQQRKEIKFV